MSGVFQGLARAFFVLFGWLSEEGHKAVKISASAALLESRRTVAFAPVVLPLLQLVPINAKLTVKLVLQSCRFSTVRNRLRNEKENRIRTQKD